MSKVEIVTKLQRLFSKDITEEAHVLYFMVEARKVMEHDGSSDRYPLLKFYADWAAHSEKDRISPEIKQMSEDIYSYAVRVINSPHGIVDEKSKALEFAYMESLSIEVTTFLAEEKITANLTTEKEAWINFASLLVKVLEGQPINNPSESVATIMFEEANPRCTALTIVFKQPVNGYPSYTMKNAY